MRNILIIIAILLPILGGARLLVSAPKSVPGKRIWCEVIACAASVIVWIVILGGPVGDFTVYSFTRGYRIAFQLDGLGMLFAGMVSLMWPFVTLYAFEYMGNAEHKNVFFAFYIMTYGVALGVCFSANILTLYVFYEMLSLVTIPLVTHYQNSESMYAGRVYAGYVIGGAAAALITVMVTTMYAIPSFSLGGHSFQELPRNFMLLIYLIGFFGFGVKAAVMPFHRWLPTASVAPTPVTALLHAAKGCLKDEDVVVKDEAAATVIIASGGYPGSYEKGKAISGLGEAAAAGAIVFHCGTKSADGKILTSGGRVLSVTGMGATLREAVDKAYAGVAKISFDKMFYRKDIAHRAFDRG